MIEIIVTVEENHETEIIGIKEAVANLLENFGDVKSVDVREQQYEQIAMWGA